MALPKAFSKSSNVTLAMDPFQTSVPQQHSGHRSGAGCETTMLASIGRLDNTEGVSEGSDCSAADHSRASVLMNEGSECGSLIYY